MIFRHDEPITRAHQWWKNGDHPDDACETILVPPPGAEADEPTHTVLTEGKVVRYFRHPNVPGDMFCTQCGVIWNDHGWIDSGGDGQVVHPGDWVATTEGGYKAYREDAWHRVIIDHEGKARLLVKNEDGDADVEEAPVTFVADCRDCDARQTFDTYGERDQWYINHRGHVIDRYEVER